MNRSWHYKNYYSFRFLSMLRFKVNHKRSGLRRSPYLWLTNPDFPYNLHLLAGSDDSKA